MFSCGCTRWKTTEYWRLTNIGESDIPQHLVRLAASWVETETFCTNHCKILHYHYLLLCVGIFHLSGVWQESPVHVVMLNCQSFDCSFAWALCMKIDVLISSFEARMSKSVSLGIYSVRLFSSKLKISCWCIFKLNWMNISRVTTFRKFCQTKPLSSPSFFFFFFVDTTWVAAEGDANEMSELTLILFKSCFGFCKCIEQAKQRLF